MKTCRLLLLLLLLFNQIYAQHNKYFQQDLKYKIDVSLDDINHVLNANLDLQYINRSSDTLSYIWFHFWPNAYSNRNTALVNQQLIHHKKQLYFAEKSELGNISGLNFKVNSAPAQLIWDEKYCDIAKLILNTPLLPGQRCFISTPFTVKLPLLKFSRLGHDKNAYAITQWYPKPAVYDQLGWHPIPYLDKGEFYSEFGEFEVNITLPKNYIVGATGNLTTDTEIEFMRQQALKFNTYSKYQEDLKLSHPASSSELKTIQFKQNRIHDFAWFADKRYYVSLDSLTLSSNDKIYTWCLFTNNEFKLWQSAQEYLKDGIKFYSEKIGNYPYQNCTMVDGTIAAGGGMEYPTIAIIGESHTALTLETTIVHELGHNWFYGILGTNERDYPWMDEGINSFYENWYLKTKYPIEKFGALNELGTTFGWIGKTTGLSKLNFQKTNHFEYAISAANNSDVAINNCSEDFTMLNYGTIVYGKTALAMNYLKNYIGDSIFNNCMQQYFSDWQFKHPGNKDIVNSFKKKYAKDIQWFFDTLLNSTEKIDFKIKQIKNNSDKIEVDVKQKHKSNYPFVISSFNNNQKVEEKWIFPVTKTTKVTFDSIGVDKIVIDPDFTTLDINSYNNSIKTNGVFKKIRPFKFKFLGEIEYPMQNTINLLPAVGWNEYNKWMFGSMIYNKFIPHKKFEYFLVPMLSFRNIKSPNFKSTEQFKSSINSIDIVGLANVNYMFFINEEKINTINVGIDIRRFAYQLSRIIHPENEHPVLNYQRYSPYIKLNFKQDPKTLAIRSEMTLQTIFLQQDKNIYDIQGGAYTRSKEDNIFYRINYKYQSANSVDPFQINLRAEMIEKYSRFETTFQYQFTYKKGNKGVMVRYYAGFTPDKYLVNKGFGFNISDRNATIGSSDYSFDQMYFDRTAADGILSRQISRNGGYFKTYTPLANNKLWVTALNISADLPGNLPIRCFADIGTNYELNKTLKRLYNIDENIIVDAGISFYLAKDAIEVFFPLYKSKAISSYFDLNKIKFGEQIRFIFDLHQLNPLLIRDKFF